MDLLEYKTEFWMKRNLTAIKYIDKLTSRIYDKIINFLFRLIETDSTKRAEIF